MRWPGAAGCVTVTLTERAVAPAGTPQAPARAKVRSASGASAGPWAGSLGSTSRQGARVKNLAALEVGVQAARFPTLVSVTESTYQPSRATLESSPARQRSRTSLPAQVARSTLTAVM